MLIEIYSAITNAPKAAADYHICHDIYFSVGSIIRHEGADCSHNFTLAKDQYDYAFKGFVNGYEIVAASVYCARLQTNIPEEIPLLPAINPKYFALPPEAINVNDPYILDRTELQYEGTSDNRYYKRIREGRYQMHGINPRSNIVHSLDEKYSFDNYHLGDTLYSA